MPDTIKKIAVIKTGGKQYKVSVGDIIKVEKLPADLKKFEFEDILNTKKVSASRVSEGKYPKVRILKFRPKKRYKKVGGHTQEFTSIKIESIA